MIDEEDFQEHYMDQYNDFDLWKSDNSDMLSYNFIMENKDKFLEFCKKEYIKKRR